MEARDEVVEATKPVEEEDELTSKETLLLRKLGTSRQKWPAAKDRSKEEKESDLSFLEAWVAARTPSENKGILGMLHHHMGGRLEVWDGDRYYCVDDLHSGLYKIDGTFEDTVKKHAGRPPAFEYDGPLYAIGGAVQSGQNLFLMTEDKGFFGLANPGDHSRGQIPPWYGGLVWTIKGGKLSLRGSLTTAEFKKLYPQVAAHGIQGGYHTAVIAPETEALWDQAPAVLEDFRNRVKLLKHCEILAVVPMRVRTWGWNDRGNGYQKRDFYRRIQMPYHTGTLLRDEIAWQTHFSLGGRLVPGVAYFLGPDRDARLLISDWCYRETPEGINEQEMFHGKHNHLDILTWMAGPATDRFLGDRSSKFKLVPIVNQKKTGEVAKALWDAMLATLAAATVVQNHDELELAVKDKARFYVWFHIHGDPTFIGEMSGPKLDKFTQRSQATLRRYIYKGTGSVHPHGNTYDLSYPLTIFPKELSEVLFSQAIGG